jgi:hypothetical protein
MAFNSIKFFDNFEGVWTDALGSGGDVIAYDDSSGWISYPSKGLTIDANQIADGSVSNTEFQYLDGVSGLIQTQLNGKLTDSEWIDASGQTISGWASTTIKKIQYKLIGNKTAILQWEIVGTGSTGGSASMTLPFTSSAWGTQYAMYQANQSSTAIGICQVTASSSTLTFYPTASIGSNFSSGQPRNLRGQMIINIT